MTVDEFLKELYGDELSDMFAGNRNSLAESRPKLLPLLNTALALAYARWECKVDTTMLTIVEGTKQYVLPETDILQVLRLVNVYGVGVPEDYYQVSGQTLYFPDPANQTFEVIYKVRPTKFTTAQDDTAVALEVPDLLVPWLKAYVCYRYFASMKTDEAMKKASDCLNQAAMCEALFVNTNTTNEFTAPANVKMEVRGFA